jgi:hypothetical protein
MPTLVTCAAPAVNMALSEAQDCVVFLNSHILGLGSSFQELTPEQVTILAVSIMGFLAVAGTFKLLRSAFF